LAQGWVLSRREWRGGGSSLRSQGFPAFPEADGRTGATAQPGRTLGLPARKRVAPPTALKPRDVRDRAHSRLRGRPRARAGAKWPAFRPTPWRERNRLPSFRACGGCSGSGMTWGSCLHRCVRRPLFYDTSSASASIVVWARIDRPRSLSCTAIGALIVSLMSGASSYRLATDPAVRFERGPWIDEQASITPRRGFGRHAQRCPGCIACRHDDHGTGPGQLKAVTCYRPPAARRRERAFGAVMTGPGRQCRSMGEANVFLVGRGGRYRPRFARRRARHPRQSTAFVVWAPGGTCRFPSDGASTERC